MNDLVATALLFLLFLLMLIGGFLIWRASQNPAPPPAKSDDTESVMAPHRLARISGKAKPVDADMPQNDAE